MAVFGISLYIFHEYNNSSPIIILGDSIFKVYISTYMSETQNLHFTQSGASNLQPEGLTWLRMIMNVAPKKSSIYL